MVTSKKYLQRKPQQSYSSNMVGFITFLLVLIVGINYGAKYVIGISPSSAYLIWYKFNKNYNLSRFDVNISNIEGWSKTDYNDYIIFIRLVSKDSRNFDKFKLLISREGKVIEEQTFSDKEFLEFIKVKD